MSSFRYALRRLLREPWFAATAIATLAVGIGACTLMFSIVRAVLLRPMGIAAPARVVVLWPTSHGNVGEFPFVSLRTLNDRLSSLNGVALIGSTNWFSRFRVPGHESADLPLAGVSASFFDVLGAPPLLGRTFRPDEDELNAPRVVVLSHGLWMRQFGADPNVIGRTVYLNDNPAEVIGVMRPEFFYPRGAEYWAPVGRMLADNAQAENLALDDVTQGVGVFYAVARLRERTTVETVRAETASYLTSVAGEQKLDLASAGMSVTALPDHIFGSARRGLLTLMGAVVAVLLIACTNVAGLLVTRGASNAREMAVRAALGAGRWTLVGQLLADSVVLAVSGAVVGIGGAAFAIGPLISLSPADIPRLDAAVIDLRVMGFAVAMTAAATIAVGLLPARRLSAPSLVADIRGAGTGRVERASRAGTRQWLVTLQVAVTVVLVIASALCVRSFARLMQLDLGFDSENVLTFSLRGTDDSPEMTRAQGDDLLDRMLARLESDPRIVAAGAVNTLPLVRGPIGWDTGVLLEGQREDVRESWSRNPNVNFLAVTPHYFRSMGILLIQGRPFTDLDRADAPSVVIVSQELANRLWPGQHPIGKRLRTGFTIRRDDNFKAGWQTVVGVVATARYRELETPRLDLYVPFRQAEPIAESFVIRTTVPPQPLVATLTAALTEMAPDTRVDRVMTMDAIVRRTRGPWLFSATVFSLFGLVALGLSWLGLFGLVAYMVTHRTHEIGVRVALGALPRDVIGLMLKHGMVPTVYGLLLGVVCAFFVTRLLTSLLFETSPTDLPTFAAVAAGFAAASLLASYLPARRAASVSPLVALRAE